MAYWRAGGKLMSGISAMFMVKAPPTYIGNQLSSVFGTNLTFGVPHPVDVGGDIIVGFAGSTRSAAVTWTASGFSEKLDQGALPSLLVATKTSSVDDSGLGFEFRASSSSNHAGYLVYFRAASYDTIGAAATIAADGTLTLPSITSAGGAIVALICAQNTATASTPTGFTQIVNTTNNGQRFVIAYKRVEAGATGTVASTVSGLSGSTIGGVLIGLK